MRNQNTRATQRRLRHLAIIVIALFGNLGVATIATGDTFVRRVAIVLIAVKLCHQKNNPLGGVELVTPKPTEDGKGKTLNAWRSLRLGGTLENEELRVAIPLRNGKNSKEATITNVPSAVSVKNLLKTISFHYQRGARITFPIFSHYAVIVIAKSGSTRQDYFNIYENPLDNNDQKEIK